MSIAPISDFVSRFGSPFSSANVKPGPLSPGRSAGSGSGRCGHWSVSVSQVGQLWLGSSCPKWNIKMALASVVVHQESFWCSNSHCSDRYITDLSPGPLGSSGSVRPRAPHTRPFFPSLKKPYGFGCGRCQAPCLLPSMIMII